MNPKQKCTVVIIAVAFILSLLFAPWEVTVHRGSTIQRSYTDAALLWSAPSVDYGTAKLRVEVIILEWAAIAIIGACLFLLLKKPSQTSNEMSKEKLIDVPQPRTDDAKESVEQAASCIKPGVAQPTEDLTVVPISPENIDNKVSVTTLIQWICLIGVAIGCSAYLLHLNNYLGGDSSEKSASWMLSEAAGGSLVLLGVPVLISFMFKKNSRFAVRLVGLCAIIFLSWLGVEERSKPMADFVSEVNEQRAGWKKDMAEQLQSKGIYNVDLAKAEQGIDAVKKKTQQLDGEAKALATALLLVNDQMLGLVKIEEIARKQLVDSGGINASTISTLEQLESRETVIKNVYKANEEILKFLQNIDGYLSAALANVELTPQQRSEAIQNYKKTASIAELQAFRKLHQETVKDLLAVMNLLRKKWGKWRVKGNAVIFDSGLAAKEFNSILGKITATEAKQVELQRRFIK